MKTLIVHGRVVLIVSGLFPFLKTVLADLYFTSTLITHTFKSALCFGKLKKYEY